MDFSFIPKSSKYTHSYLEEPFHAKQEDSEREIPLPSIQAALSEPLQLRRQQAQRKANVVQYDVPYSVLNKDLLTFVDEAIVIKQVEVQGSKEKMNTVDPNQEISNGKLNKIEVSKFLKGIKLLAGIKAEEKCIVSTSFLISFVMLQDRMHVPFDVVVRKQGHRYTLLPRVGSIADLVTTNEIAQNESTSQWMENTLVNDLFNTQYPPEYDVTKYSTEYLSVLYNHPKHNKMSCFPVLHESIQQNMQAISNVIKNNANQLGRNALSCLLNGSDMQTLLVTKNTYDFSIMRLNINECVTMMGLDEQKSWNFFIGWCLSIFDKISTDGFYSISKEHRQSTKIYSIPNEFVQRMVRQ